MVQVLLHPALHNAVIMYYSNSTTLTHMNERNRNNPSIILAAGYSSLVAFE